MYKYLSKKNFFSACGAHLTATSTVQSFVSHARYGDNNYDNRVDCEWKIQASEGHGVQLKFTAFDLEDEAECGWVVRVASHMWFV